MKSLANRIASQFSLVIALMVFVLSIILLAIIGRSERRAIAREIDAAMREIMAAQRSGDSLHAVEAGLSYYISYTVYDADTRQVVATNDPFIPVLPPTEGRQSAYHEKGYYTDGDLDVLYKTQAAGAYVVQVSVSRDSEDYTMHLWYLAPRLFAIVLLPLLIVSYLAAFWIAKHTLRPIVRMTRTAASIGSSNLDTMLDVTARHDELDSLAGTFNELFSRIRQDFIAVNAANQAKSAFLSNMSHEIRTPINAVLGLDEMILRESTEDVIKGYARDIQSSGRSLLSIINDILDFSKIEAGKMDIIPVDYDLCTMVGDLVNMVSARAEHKGLEFIVRVDPAMPHLLHGDETRVKQCILNILTNAVKYTPKGSVTMSIGYEKAGGDAILLRARVVDTGIGIREEDIQKLFSPFERIEERRNRTIEGTGLGMSIVKSLLAAMGTRLEVRSVYGSGSDFSFAVEQGVRGWEPVGDYGAMREKAARQAAAYTESFQAPDAHILVVDDTPLNLTVIRGLLKATRVRLDTAESARAALDMARETSYHLLLVDHRMPGMDGIEMLHALRADGAGRNQHTPCIALTANAISGAREMYLAEGFEGYLSKPVESAQLEAALMRHLPRRLLLHPGDAGFAASPRGAAQDGTERRAAGADGPAEALFARLFGVRLGDALRNCGGADVFMDVARTFCGAAAGKADDIERYAAARDWDNYTVLVHALKSSARLIGAAELAGQAACLEGLGDAARRDAAGGGAGAAAEIAQKTPALLALYRDYAGRLAPLFGAAPRVQAAAPISREQLDKALADLREVVSVFDFDSADAIVSELSGHALPEDFAETFAGIRRAVQAVDYAAAMRLL